MKARWIAGMLGVFGTSLVLAGHLYAQSGTIYACVNNSNGEVKFVSANTKCNINWHLVTWNVAGAQGPAGPSARTEPMDFTVDCNSGATIQGTLEQELIPGDRLLVSGTCNENVTIREEIVRITLDGQGTATLNGPDSTQNTITVRGRGITIKGFSISGARSGINVRGGTATIDGNVIQNMGVNGINVGDGGFATIVSSTISGNNGAGISIFNGGGARVGITAGNTISSNERGISLSRGTATISGNTISDNRNNGVGVFDGSSADISDNTISNNSAAGISLFNRGTANITGNNTITGNKGAGVSVSDASSVVIGQPGVSQNANTITGNGADDGRFGSFGGVAAFGGSWVDIRNADISGNTGPAGVLVHSRSIARISGGSINGNSEQGIRLRFGAALFLFDNVVTVTGNSGFGLQCFDAESSFVGNTSGIVGNSAGDLDENCTGF